MSKSDPDYRCKHTLAGAESELSQAPLMCLNSALH